jgi:hypothetical protein
MIRNNNISLCPVKKQIKIMKNLHLIPTDKPSRLHLWTDENDSKLALCDLEFSHTRNTQNIYITSDEEIKQGDWFIRDGSIHKCFRVHKTDIEFLTSIDSVYCGSNTFWSKGFCKKIILTTDQDLIKDGVQAIDYEFLKWFVKNPSCEEVETKLIEDIPSGFTFGMFGNDEPPTELVYKIIIPKEEPKQRLEKYSERFDNKDNELVEGIFNPDTWGKRMVDDAPKEITLEEVFNDEKREGVKKIIDQHKVLKGLSLINPLHLQMTSNGHGEFPDGYKLTEKGIQYIIEKLNKV